MAEVIIFIVAGVLLAGFITYSMTMPRIEETKTVAETLRTKQQELNKIRNNENKLPTLQANVEKLEQELDSLEKFFPDKVDLPRLISRITKVARSEDIFATTFKPKAPVKREYYIENSYEITVLGSYHNLGKFFARIANFDLIVNVNGMKLTTSSGVQKELSEYLKLHDITDPYDNSVKSTKAVFSITTYSSLPDAEKGAN
jgi:type IV pilus assembly protein PilO